MQDRQIVELYLSRSEQAIEESQKKYGGSLRALAFSLLSVREDAEECENDTYLTAWNRIPPDEPTYLGAYLSKITRFLCMNLLRRRTAEKRPAHTALLDELQECLPTPGSIDETLEAGRLRETLDRFVRSLPDEQRFAFLRRYFFGESVEQIAKRLSCGQGKVKTLLFRARGKLKETLEKEELL